MRCIGQLPAETLARRFSAYLYVQRIENTLERLEDGTCNIWVHDENVLCRAKILLADFSRRPNHEQYQEAERQARHPRAQSQSEQRAYQKRLFYRSRLFLGNNGSIGPLTSILIAVSLIMTAHCGFGRNDDVLTYFLISNDPMAGVGLDWWNGLTKISRAQVWRLFTPMFIHFSILHLTFNMLWLQHLGTIIEQHRGSRFLGLFVLVTGAVSNLVQYADSGPMFGGMSGVVYGLFGYVWVHDQASPSSGLYLNQNTVAIMIVWLVLGFAGLLGNVANMEHGAGLLVGVTWGSISGWFTKDKPRPFEKITVMLGVIAVGGSLAGTIYHVRLASWQRADGFFNLDNAPHRVLIVPTRQGAPHYKQFDVNDRSLQLNQPVVSILTWAYDVPNQRRMILNTALPEGEYDVLANLPSESRLGMQLALRDKFGLVGRWEKRDVEVLRLKLARSTAPGLRRSVHNRSPTASYYGYIAGVGKPISSLVEALEEVMDRPILNETGLWHHYDFVLEWNGHGLRHPDPEDFNQVLLDQLGLELVPGWEPLPMLVVNAEKISTNLIPR